MTYTHGMYAFATNAGSPTYRKRQKQKKIDREREWICTKWIKICVWKRLEQSVSRKTHESWLRTTARLFRKPEKRWTKSRITYVLTPFYLVLSSFACINTLHTHSLIHFPTQTHYLVLDRFQPENEKMCALNFSQNMLTSTLQSEKVVKSFLTFICQYMRDSLCSTYTHAHRNRHKKKKQRHKFMQCVCQVCCVPSFNRSLVHSFVCFVKRCEICQIRERRKVKWLEGGAKCVDGILSQHCYDSPFFQCYNWFISKWIFNDVECSVTLCNLFLETKKRRKNPNIQFFPLLLLLLFTSFL